MMNMSDRLKATTGIKSKNREEMRKDPAFLEAVGSFLDPYSDPDQYIKD